MRAPGDPAPPGRVGRADDRHRAQTARPALDPLLARAELVADGERSDLGDPRRLPGGGLLGAGGNRQRPDRDAAADQAPPQECEP